MIDEFLWVLILCSFIFLLVPETEYKCKAYTNEKNWYDQVEGNLDQQKNRHKLSTLYLITIQFDLALSWFSFISVSAGDDPSQWVAPRHAQEKVE